MNLELGKDNGGGTKVTKNEIQKAGDLVLFSKFKAGILRLVENLLKIILV